MKRKLAQILGVMAVSIGVGVTGPISLYAADTEKPAVAAEDQSGGDTLAIPDTASAIWQAIDKEMGEMSELVGAGTIEDLHHHAYAVRDLFAALPGRSGGLAADKLEKVKTDVKFVATLASRLDEAGDSKDRAAAAANFKKLQDLLKSARENYPATNTP